MKKEAQRLFGMTFTGLSIDECDYNTFETWYNKHHCVKCTKHIYDIAKWIWENYE